MPPRPPPPPTTLTVLCTLAALAMGWGAHALDVLVRAWAGSLAGVPVAGIRIAAQAPWLVEVQQGAAPRIAAGSWALIALSGPVALVAVFGLAHLATGVIRTSGVSRALALEGFLLAVLWLPTALAAAAVGGGGPVSELYGRLGDPQAGRWAAGALALLLVGLSGGLLAGRAVAVGRSWMRVDGLEFRRRLVRVVAGYPAAVAIGTIIVVAGWGSAWLTAGWVIVILITLRIRTA